MTRRDSVVDDTLHNDVPSSNTQYKQEKTNGNLYGKKNNVRIKQIKCDSYGKE